MQRQVKWGCLGLPVALLCVARVLQQKCHSIFLYSNPLESVGFAVIVLR